MEIYKDEYLVCRFNSDLSLLEQKWLETTEDMSIDSFKKLSFKLLELYKKCDANKLLTDGTDFKFSISPELQEWTVKNIISGFIEKGITKYANVVPKDLFANVSAEQMIEEGIDAYPFTVKYFDSLDTAYKWLAE